MPPPALSRLALEPKELGLAIEGEARCRVVGLDEAPAGSTRLLERVRPRPAELQDLGAMDEAAPGEGDHVRLLPAPAVERQRPLTRAAKLEDLLAREDDGAVDEAGDDRRQVLGRHRDHRLVEEREALVHPRVDRRGLPLQEHGEREEVAICERPRDGGGIRGDGSRRSCTRRP